MLVMAEDRPTFAFDGDAGAALVLLRAVDQGMCLAKPDGTMAWCNPAFTRLDEGLKQRIAAGCKRLGAAITGTGPGGTVAGGGVRNTVPARHTFDAVSSDDATTYEVLITPVTSGESGGQAGQTTYLAAVVIDVTAQRRREARMHAIDAAGAELLRLDVEQIKKMNPAERLGVLEEKIIRFAHDLLHFDHFAIRLVDRETDKLELVIYCGLPAPALAVDLYARSEGNGISGYVAATGRSYLCADTTHDPRYVIGVESARSSLTVPLRLSDKVIGVFNVESTQAGFFSEEDRQFAEMFATYIALALHILNLLVAERSTTGQAMTGTMEGELSEPLTDLTQVAAKLKESLGHAPGGPALAGSGNPAPAPGEALPGAGDPKVLKIIEKILEDVEAIKKRVKNVGAGAATVLGADDAVLRAARTTDPILRGKRVLVTDDDQRIRQLVSEVLRARGAEVIACENGTAAIGAIQKLASGIGAVGGGAAVPGQERSSATGGAGTGGSGGSGGGHGAGGFRTLDLILSDIHLPDKTGYEIFTAARAVLPQVPVILMTGFGYDPHHSIVRASQAGLSAVLFKPFQAERLIEEAHKALGAGR